MASREDAQLQVLDRIATALEQIARNGDEISCLMQVAVEAIEDYPRDKLGRARVLVETRDDEPPLVADANGLAVHATYDDPEASS